MPRSGGCTTAVCAVCGSTWSPATARREDQLDTLARRLAPLGWHIQFYVEGDKLAEVAPRLAKLPVDVVIDHAGGVKAALGTAHPQFQSLLRLLDSGRAWIKVCHYRASSVGQPWDDVAPNVQALVAAAPERCVWGTDWPHPQMDPVPEAGLLFDQFVEWVPDAALRQRVLVDNPAKLYRILIETQAGQSKGTMNAMKALPLPLREGGRGRGAANLKSSTLVVPHRTHTTLRVASVTEP